MTDRMYAFTPVPGKKEHYGFTYAGDGLTLPMFDDEDGNFWGWGHIDKQEYLDQIITIWRLHGVYEDMYEDSPHFPTVDSIKHTYCQSIAMPEDVEVYETAENVPEDLLRFHLAKETDELAYPVTIYNWN